MSVDDSENDDWAIIFSNTKTKKRSLDILSISDAFERLIDAEGDVKKVSNKAGLHPEMIREFLKAKTLPQEVRDMIKNREIDSVDTVRALSTLKNNKQQIQLAKETKNLTSMEVRDVAKLIKEARISVEDAVSRVTGSRKEAVHLLFISLDNKHFKLLKKFSSTIGVSEAVYLEQIVEKFLERHNEGEELGTD